MYFDGINLAEGSTVQNLTVQSGDTFPAAATVGELFYKTGSGQGLFVYDGGTWVNFAANSFVEALSDVPFVISTSNASLPNALVLASIGPGFVKTSGGNLTSAASIDLSGSDVSGYLSAANFPALAGDLVGTNGSLNVALSNTGVAAGTYNKVTVDAKGRVTSAVAATTLAGLGITDAASLGGSAAQSFAVNNLNVTGDILPVTNGTQNIGSASLRWSTIFVDEAKLSVNTLYIGDTPILGTQADTIRIKADPGQSIWMSTTGVGSTLITSENQVQISTSGMNADVILNATGAGADVRLGSASSIVLTAPTTQVVGDETVSGTLTVGGTATFNGNVVFNGTTTTVNSTTVTTKDNIIVVNQGEVGSGVTSGKAGIQVDRGELADYQIVFDETDDMFKVGQVGSLETLASWNWVGANYAPLAHVGSGGTAHAAATGSVAGFMSAADKSKLDGIASGANLYVHPASGVSAATYTKVTVDVNGHVTAGASLVAADIPSLDWSKISTGKPTTLAGYGIADAYTKTETDSRIQAVIGAAPAALDTLTELAAALGNDANFATTTTNALATKASISYVDSQIASVTAGNVATASAADKLTTARTIGMTGDVTWSVSFDGSANVSAAGTLANSGVTAGTYPKVTVNAKGLVTGGASLVAADIPSLDWSKITSGKPTTAAGYGIGDVYTKTEVDSSLAGKINTTAIGAANGVASLGADGKVPAAQLPSYVDDVLEYAATGNFPATGETGKIYVATGTNKTYRWSGSVYVEISAAPGSTDAVVEGTTNLYFTDARAQAAVANITIDGGSF